MKQKIARRTAELRKGLGLLKKEAGLVYRVDCTEEENDAIWEMRENGGSLPEDVYEYGNTGDFFRIYELNMTMEEQNQYVILEMRRTLRSIRIMVAGILALLIIPVFYAAIELIRVMFG